MFKLFKFVVMSEKELAKQKWDYYMDRKVAWEDVCEETVYNCGYKSCQFQTTSPAGLKRHRTMIHRKK
jgi:hypothetical protein